MYIALLIGQLHDDDIFLDLGEIDKLKKGAKTKLVRVNHSGLQNRITHISNHLYLSEFAKTWQKSAFCNERKLHCVRRLSACQTKWAGKSNSEDNGTKWLSEGARST